VIFVPFVVCFSVAFVVAQTPVFRGGVETVEVTVTVVDAQGRIVTGVTKDDFIIYEDGQIQPITTFSDERAPVSLGVVLDVSDSMVGQPIADARRALDRFVGTLLEPGDEAFASTFNHESQIVAGWTRPPALLEGRMNAITPTGSTAIYDALAAAASLFTSRRHGRAALVVISDGADTASDLTLVKARDILQRTDPFVYAIAIDSSRYPRASSRVSPETLREITGPSGGYTEVVKDSAELGPATERIAYELNHQYTLGYASSRPPDGSWRGIRVRMRHKDHFARARRGYFSTPSKPRSE
jgi:Ca-activated chloride channel homolog